MFDYGEKLYKFLPTEKDITKFGKSDEAESLIKSFEKTLIWIKLLSIKKNVCCEVLLPSLHSKIIEFWILVPMGLLHSAYSSLRTMIDISAAYSFYITHPMEWNALCRGKIDWEGRESIIKWHIHHTPTFKEYNESFGIQDKLLNHYRDLSMYIHAIPIKGLPMLRSLDKVEISERELKGIIESAQNVDKCINELYIPIFYKTLHILDATEKDVILLGLDKKKLITAGIIIA